MVVYKPDFRFVDITDTLRIREVAEYYSIYVCSMVSFSENPENLPNIGKGGDMYTPRFLFYFI